MTSLPDRAQADLLTARKARDEAAVIALRTLLAAISNAEAPRVPTSSSIAPPSLGLIEHARLELTHDDHQQILREQLEQRQVAAAEYDAIGQADAATALRAEIGVLERYLA